MCTEESIDAAADLLSALCSGRPEGVHQIAALVGNPQMAPHREGDSLVVYGSAQVVITSDEVKPDADAEVEALFRMVSMMRHEEAGGYLVYVHADATPPVRTGWRVLPEGVIPLRAGDLLALHEALAADPQTPGVLIPAEEITLEDASPVPEGVL
jgi:hypothetical protein